MWSSFSLRTARLYRKIFPLTSKSKNKITKKADSSELMPCQALRRTSVRVPIGRVLCTINIESIFSMFSSWPSLTGRANSESHGEEKERLSATRSDGAVILAPCHENSEYYCNPGHFRKQLIFVLFVNSLKL